MNEHAAAVLKNPAWRQAWDTLHGELHDAIEAIPPHETEMLSAIAHRLWALREVRAELERLMAAETEPDAG
jgi:hypothetical protein